MRHFSHCLVALCAVALPFVIPAAVVAVEAPQRQHFPVVLSGARISFGSPTLADITRDGRPEIIVGGSDGKVYAITGAGQVLWTYNATAAIDAKVGRSSGKPATIRTAPSVGDLTGDGVPEIVVAVGDIFPEPMNGGVVALNAQGRPLPGWPQVPLDFAGGVGGIGGPDGYTDGVLTTPAIADITGDGKPEIIYGANDQRVYAKQANGGNTAGWPQFVLDTVWSSSAVADLNGDGRRDVVIGVDAHFYRGPPRNSEAGGDLYAFNGDGSIQWRAHQDEIFQSSPAIADLDGDGTLEIAAGTGTFYSGQKPRSSIGRYFSVWNYDGRLRWRTRLPEQVFGSPAIGDVTGDSRLEVVVGALDGKVYTFDGSTGAIRWSSLARDIFNNKFIPNPEVNSPVLGDFDGDGRDDVFVALGWDVVVMNGTTGALLTGASANPPSDPKPSFYGAYTVMGTPAIGDLDGNGKLDLVSASGTTSNPGKAQVNAWALAGSTPKASWPQFHASPPHTGVYPQLLAIRSLAAVIKSGTSRSDTIAFGRSDVSAFSWSVTERDPGGVITLNRTSGSAGDTLTVSFRAPATPGTSTATLTVQSPGAPPVTIQLKLVAASQVFGTSLPLIRR